MPTKLMKWFRIVGFVEGLSLILLLFVAMPLKYMLDMPTAVTIVGSIHGGLFILYMVMVAIVTLVVRWSFKWIAGGPLVRAHGRLGRPPPSHTEKSTPTCRRVKKMSTDPVSPG
jgi:integral membrane protein